MLIFDYFTFLFLISCIFFSFNAFTRDNNLTSFGIFFWFCIYLGFFSLTFYYYELKKLGFSPIELKDNY